MKRWLAGMLAMFLLLAGGPAAAEGISGVSNAEIHNSVEVREDETSGTLVGNLMFLIELSENDDVRNLLQIQDVRILLSEGVGKTLIWMYENRPVTMKILTELGVTEEEKHYISLLWDSTERVSDAWNRYFESDDGKQLAQEIMNLVNDPEMKASWDQLKAMIASEEIPEVLENLRETVEEVPDTDEGPLTQEAAEKQLDGSTLTGRLLLRILGFMERSEWAMELLPGLIRNENLWLVLIHLAGNREMEQALKKEIQILAEDPGMIAFLQRTAQDVMVLVRKMDRKAPAPEQQSGENNHKE